MGDKIEITKDNYKAYTELYEELTTISASEFKNVKLITIFTTIGVPIGGGILATIINPVIGYIGAGVLGSTGFYSAYKYIKKTDTKRRTKIKQKYPDKNINVNVKKQELEKELEKVGIIKKERYKEYITTIIDEKVFEEKIKKFEEKLKQEEVIEKCEKIKQATFEKNKYDFTNLTVEPYLSEQELTKVKGQVKTLVKKK